MAVCAICDRLGKINSDPALIHEFGHSYLLLGNHQYFKGYCILLYKWHVRELHELEPDSQTALNQELMLATRAIAMTFEPWKMNHACLGNQDQHIHWHIIPRYESEADRHEDPWKHAAEFDQCKASEAQQKDLIMLIRPNILLAQERIKI